MKKLSKLSIPPILHRAG